MVDVLRFLSWYIIITLVGWAAFPLAYRFFPRLPDRGYALARWKWVRGMRSYIISAEAVFLGAFALLAIIRAANPTIDGTEKPMELAFLNAILKSPTFPPHDPWLSGYAISYYYFGYVLVTMLIRASAVSSPCAIAQSFPVQPEGSGAALTSVSWELIPFVAAAARA